MAEHDPALVELLTDAIRDEIWVPACEHVIANDVWDGACADCREPEVRRVVERVLSALADAGHLLPPGGRTDEEWGVDWHAGDSDGIVLAESQIGSRALAERIARKRIGDYGITRYTLRYCVHRVWPDGTTLIGPWQPAPEET